MERIRQALRAVSSAITTFSETTTDYERLLDTVVKSVAEILQDTCIVTLRSEDGVPVAPVAMYDEAPKVRAAFATMLQHPLGFGHAVTLVAEGGTMFLPSVDLAGLPGPISPAGQAFLVGIGVRGMLVVPLRVRGELLGVLTVLRHRQDLPPLDELDREVAEHLATHAALALGNARLYRRMTDELEARRRAERALEESEALRRSEARALEATRFLDAIIENIPDMVFVKDAAELRFVRFNRAGEEFLGFARADLIGKNDFDFFPATEAEFFVAKDRETLASKALVDVLEEPIQTRGGERWLHTKKVPILDEAGEPRYLLGISQDITDRKTYVAALAAAKEAAEAANRELESFSYSVAHDLRAPLRAIDGFSVALLDDYGPALGEVGRGYLDRVRGASQRMAVLIDDLLALSRVTRAELVCVPVDLSAVARATLTRLERAAPERAVSVTIAADLRAPGDPRLLEIAFDNLVGNAWKFTSKRADARIEIGAETVDGERRYFVRDNGAGFDMAYRDKLFGVFQRLHAATDFPGTGIGLATVKRIVERHGGKVWGEGVVGEGATFYFTLHAASAAPA